MDTIMLRCILKKSQIMPSKKFSNCAFSAKIVFKQWLQLLMVHVSMIPPIGHFIL
jgi:hypothetical protein